MTVEALERKELGEIVSMCNYLTYKFKNAEQGTTPTLEDLADVVGVVHRLAAVLTHELNARTGEEVIG